MTPLCCLVCLIKKREIQGLEQVYVRYAGGNKEDDEWVDVTEDRVRTRRPEFHSEAQLTRLKQVFQVWMDDLQGSTSRFSSSSFSLNVPELVKELNGFEHGRYVDATSISNWMSAKRTYDKSSKGNKRRLEDADTRACKTRSGPSNRDWAMALQEEAKQKRAVKATEKAEKAETKEVRLIDILKNATKFQKSVRHEEDHLIGTGRWHCRRRRSRSAR